MTQGSAAAPAKLPERQGLLSVFVNVFVEPRAAFQQVAVAPRWWFPMALIIVATFVYMSLFSTRIGWDNFIRQQVERNERMQEMPADQRERAIEMQMKFVPIWGMVGPPVFISVGMAVTAGVLVFVFRTLLDGSVRFGQALGVVAWSSVPGLLSTAAALAVMLLKNPADFDLANPVGFNIGFYLPEGTSAWIVSLGNSIDLFSFWTILLLATGMAVVTRKSWGTALGGILLPWAIYLVCKVGWSAMFG
jgi:hypothetical protein